MGKTPNLCYNYEMPEQTTSPDTGEETQTLEQVLQSSIASIDARLQGTQGDVATLMNSGDTQQRLAFNQSLIASMAEQVKHWEQKKPFELRISQLRGLKKLIEFLEKGGNEWNTGYFRQPTGAGKTVLYSLFARLLNRKTVIFVPKNNLLTQTKEEMVNLGIPEGSIGIVGDGNYELGKQFLLVTYASHNSKMSSDEAYTTELRACDVMI